MLFYQNLKIGLFVPICARFIHKIVLRNEKRQRAFKNYYSYYYYYYLLLRVVVVLKCSGEHPHSIRFYNLVALGGKKRLDLLTTISFGVQ